MAAEQPIIPVEEQFKIMADSAPVLIWISGVDKLCYFFNAGWLRFTGRSLEQEQGNGWAEGVHPDDMQRCLAIYTRAFDARQDFKMEYRLKRHDGVYRWLMDTGVPRYAANGEFAGYIGSCMDIDELLESARAKQEYADIKLQEEQAANEVLEAKVEMRVTELLASEDRFRSLIEQAPVAIAVLHGRELLIESANKKILEIWGKTESVIGWKLAEALPEIKGQPFLGILDQVLTTGEPFYGSELLAKLEHGGQLQDIYINFVYQPFFNASGDATDIMVVATDVTGQVQARREVERAYEQARLSKEAASLGTFDLDLLKDTMEWDERCRILFGISHQGPVTYKKDFITGLHPDDRARVLQVIDQVMIKSVNNGNYDVEYRTVGVDDQQIRWVRAKGKAYFNEQDQPVRFIGSVLDITAQKNYDDRLQRYTRNVEILNTVGKLVAESLDIEAILQKVTDATTQITGAGFGAFFYNQLDERGESYMLFTLSGAPREAFEKFGMPRNTAVFNPTFSGQEVVRVADITKDPRYGHNHPHHGMPKGHLPVVSYLAVPVIAKSGSVIGGLFYGHPEPGKFTAEHENLVVGIANQASVALDNAKLYEEIQQLNSKKDEFIGLASHELKTPITSLNGYLQIVSRRLPEGDMNKSFVDKALLQIHKLSDLISDLLDVSKIESGQLPLSLTSFDLVEFLREVIEQFQYSTRTHHIAFQSDSSSLMISADQQRIEQVVINLLSNAVKYSPGADLVRVSVSGNAHQVIVGVQDFGMGISKEQQGRIFSRFYRVEDVAAHISGLGIGLYISKEIISRHHGLLKLESESGKGSVFSFEIPTG